MKSMIIIMVYLILLTQAVYANDPGAKDTVKVGSIEVTPHKEKPVEFSVPVTLFNDEALHAAAMGLYYDSDYLRIDSISSKGTRAENANVSHSARPKKQLAVVGWVYMPQLPPPFGPLKEGNDVIANLYFTLRGGAPDHTITIDSGFYPKAGYFILTTKTATSIKPHFVPGKIVVKSKDK
jgi:hypothetical protein